ncbi:gonadotropin-releasing hormone receptor [Trichonephila clavata]|uniref:Gonadotropin-releasing hormone receptor n=1 Tax=Trichonephila clavata TaxID=2740835 RepID=A0A8X6HXC7_TRICU|nr:gonadotropin-releasing hormone receptor [Trichonephila clavata]
MLLRNLSTILLNFFVLYLLLVFEIHVFGGYNLANASIIYDKENNFKEIHHTKRNDRIENTKPNVPEFVSKFVAKLSTDKVTGRNALRELKYKNVSKRLDSLGIYEEIQIKDKKAFATIHDSTFAILPNLNTSKEEINNDFKLNTSTDKKTISSPVRPPRRFPLSMESFRTSILNVSKIFTTPIETLFFTKVKDDTKDSQSSSLPQNTFKSGVASFLEYKNNSFINTEATTEMLEEMTFEVNESTIEWKITKDCKNSTTCNETYQHAPTLNSHSLVKGVVLLNFGILAFISNVAALGSIIRRDIHLSSSIYLLLAHLCVSDIFVTSFCIIGEGLWTLTVEWNAGNWLCKCFKFFQMFSLYLSTFTLVVIGFDRLYAVKCPLNRFKARIHVHRSIISIWIISSVLSAPQSQLNAYNLLENHSSQ